MAVREFLVSAQEGGLFTAQNDSWLSGYSPEFSAELGRRGWIGMTWPTRFGGRETTTEHRFAVIEELLAAGAPVAAHWFSDRQIGPGLLRHGTPGQQQKFLPDMAAGKLFFCIGMSEPQSGSDLGSVRTRATKVPGGWTVNGSKVWTSHAQHAHFMLALVRTGAVDERPGTALTQLILDMAAPGITVRPIEMLDGRRHFCEVFFDEVFVPDEQILGRPGHGWAQVLGELAFERSGPERFLSTFPLLTEFFSAPTTSVAEAVDVGRIISRLAVLRAMSARINAQLDGPEAPGAAAALVKDIGTRLENESIDVVRRWSGDTAQLLPGSRLAELLFDAQRHAPGFTLRGGTNEILRGIVDKTMGVT